MLDISDLYKFVTYIDCGTLSAAAEKLHISQPTLTRTMHNVRNQHTITIHSCAPAPLWSLLPELSRRFPDNIISSKMTNMNDIIQNVISGNSDIGILPQSCSDKDILCIPYLKEQLYVCIPKGHKLAEHSQLSLSQINGFNCLLRDEIGFWTDLVKSKMPASHFLIQTDEFEFKELVKTSTFLCFSSNKATDLDQILKGRKQIPLTDPEVNVTYHMIGFTKSAILQSVSPTFEFRHQK